MPFADSLATLNAALNLTCFTCLLLGYRAIRAGRVQRHRRLMLTALTCSIVFLVSYLTRFALSGVHRFPEVGALKTLYLSILGSHTLLAASLLALVPMTVKRALAGDFERHRRIARWTFPIWAYVSMTGVIVYVMLYHVAPRL